MSLNRFIRETGEAMLQAGLSDDQAQAHVRDQWIARRDYAPLVAAILANWTSGNCIAFMTPVTQALLADNEPDLHHRLWARSIKRQCDDFFREYASLRGQKLSSLDILAVNADGFDEFDPDSYADKRTAASFLLKRLFASLQHCKVELLDAGFDPAAVAPIIDSLRHLRKPRIAMERPAQDTDSP